MRYFLLLLALLLAAGPAVAQNPVAARPDSLVAVQAAPDSLVAVQAAPDTAAAIHRLFADRRKTSHLLTGTLLGVTVIAFLGDTRPLSVVAADLPLVAALVAPFEIAILLAHKKYSKKAEARALLALQAHQLPPKIRRRLRARHFQLAPGKK